MRLRGTTRRLEQAGLGRSGWMARAWWRMATAGSLLAAWWALAVSAATAPPSEQPIRIPLNPLGFQTLSSDFLAAGTSMFTVDFVDNTHLLVTFCVHRLMQRETDPPPDDDDRTVKAVLLELPSGKVEAQTEWRTHDRSRYLWNLGHGRFLLRIRDSLNVLAPLDPANQNDRLRETPLLQMDRRIVAILVSSAGDLLTVESTKRPGVVLAAEGQTTDSAPVQINFYRLRDGDGALKAISAGAIRTRNAVELPMTTAGFLDIFDDGKGTWLFNFDELAGKVNELLAFDTSCFPRATFVGHSEFVVFGCRGSDDKQDVAAFNLKGEEMWQQNFTDTHVTPTFSFAPEAGRFALGRTIVAGLMDPESLPAAAVSGQEVRVYQSYNGRQLFRMDCSPAERAGQNFALSPDGMRIAVVREVLVRHAATKDYEAYVEHSTGVEVYTLPPLTDKDRSAVKQAETSAPADTGGRIDVALARISAKKAAATVTGELSPSAKDTAAKDTAQAKQAPPSIADAVAAAAPSPPEPPAPTTTAQAGSEPPASPTAIGDPPVANEGDVEQTGPRKPPTLYSPDEKNPSKPQ